MEVTHGDLDRRGMVGTKAQLEQTQRRGMGERKAGSQQLSWEAEQTEELAREEGLWSFTV